MHTSQHTYIHTIKTYICKNIHPHTTRKRHGDSSPLLTKMKRTVQRKTTTQNNAQDSAHNLLLAAGGGENHGLVEKVKSTTATRFLRGRGGCLATSKQVLLTGRRLAVAGRRRSSLRSGWCLCLACRLQRKTRLPVGYCPFPASQPPQESGGNERMHNTKTTMCMHKDV